jgi:signal transduction histidine kinase
MSKRTRKLASGASAFLTESFDAHETIEKVARLLVPEVAELCVVDLFDSDQRGTERIALWAHDDRVDLQRTARPAVRDLPNGLAFEIADRKPQVIVGVTAEMLHALGIDPLLAEHDRELRAESLLTTPLLVRRAAIGTLMLISKTRQFDDEDQWLALDLANAVAAAIEYERVFSAERRARFRMARMQDVVAAFSRSGTAEEVAEVACRIGSEALEASSGALWVAREDGSLRLAGTWGTPKEFIEQFEIIPANATGAPAIDVVRTGQPVWVESEADYSRIAPEIFTRARGAGRVSAYGAVPLNLGGRVAGVVVFAHEVGHRYDPDERAFFVTLAQHCSQALDRALLLDAERNANRIKDEFLATVSHELRTPLNAIIGWSTLLAEKLDDPAALSKGLEVIHRNAQAQTKLVDDILDVSRIITGKLKIDPRPVDMIAIVRDGIDVVRPSAEAKRLSIRLEACDPPYRLIGDAQRLQQVAWNLLSNAVKFSDEGGSIAIRIEQRGPTISLSVTDTGRGIEPDFLPYVFERFRQADSSTTRRFGGLGLGLAIVRHIVELHGGRVFADSDGLGKGATFRITLPVRAVIAPPPAEARSLEARVSGPAIETGDVLGIRILVLDDEADARELVQTVLEDQGAVVETAASAQAALDAIERFRPDVIVSDVAMPQEDGYSFIRRVRARGPDEGGATPAIALTAYARREDRQRALKEGFNDHIAKPIDAHELIAAISTLHRLRAG